MKAPHDNDLLLDYLHEQLPRDQQDAFFGRLRGEPDLARRLLALAADEELLREWASGPGPLAADLPIANPPSLVAGASRGRSRWRRRFALPAIAGLLLLALVGVWWARLPVVVAQVDHAASAQGLEQGFGWKTLRAGASLRFDAGVVELTLTSGARLVVEGPCACRLESADRIRLLSGRLYADVPESGRGLTILTPDGEIVDLGTRFGVEVQPGKGTEVHVFQGNVTAELAGGKTEKSQLQAGQAVRFDAREHVVRNVPLSRNFVQQAGAYVEHFDYSPGVLAGKADWFDSRLLPRPLLVGSRNLQYPGLAESTGAALTVGSPQGEIASPVGRRWHDRYISMVIDPDDDFPKRLALPPATLASFGSLDDPTTSPVQIVTRKSNLRDRQSSELGLLVDGDFQYARTADFRGEHPCLIVMRWSDDQVDLWINPPDSSLGGRVPPEPNVTLPRRLRQPLEALWINDAFNPPITHFYVDAIRGGSTWAEVTPRAKGE
ncbi:FecR domain-containing protein [Lignipirellula cremea]|uniref:FecR protein n=1 Tax=Lignipirellula cremea TaxID=2528010 RepID=A0A518DL18_9BACT|nr:FecR family protein [Lignipirellula cremea]QDU92524.1 FecR protein [Lignipirellula cremea]